VDQRVWLAVLMTMFGDGRQSPGGKKPLHARQGAFRLAVMTSAPAVTCPKTA
jgi:hypothetical protein